MKTKKFGMHNDVKLYIINVQYDRGKKKNEIISQIWLQKRYLFVVLDN